MLQVFKIRKKGEELTNWIQSFASNKNLRIILQFVYLPLNKYEPQ